MPRRARERSESGIYHVVLRGVNRGKIFCDEEDNRYFLETVLRKKSEGQFDVYGYCLMVNHVHLLLKEKRDEIGRIMSRIGTSYAWWYNKKYNRSGHVFQGRYGSECVENDSYLLTVIRYIHNNPVKAKMVGEAEEYPWSSIHAYYGGVDIFDGLTASEFILEMIHENRKEAIEGFRSFMKMENQDKCLDDENRSCKTDEELKAEIESRMNGAPIKSLLTMERGKQKEILREIKKSASVNQRQIARVTGISQDIIYKL